MQRSFGLVFVVVILLIAGGFWMKRNSDEKAKAQIEVKLTEARKAFAGASQLAAKADSTAAYRRGIQVAMQAYEDALSKEVYAKHANWRDPDAYLKKLKESEDKGEVKAAVAAKKRETFEIVKKAYDTLKGGWHTTLSAVGPGEVRLDVYDLHLKTDGPQPMLEGELLLWGVEGKPVNWGSLDVRYWTKREKKKRRGKTELVDEVYGKANGSATPRYIMYSPKDYIAEFPSNVAVGRIWWPAMPPAATRADIDLDFSVRALGGEVDNRMSWTVEPIPAAWKLPEGSWKADVVEATADEISGKNAEAER